MVASGSNSQTVKLQNRAAIMRLILRGEAVTRKDLAAVTGLTKATVSVAVTELIRNGLLHEGGSESVPAGISGPRPTLLEIRPEARLTLGVSLSDDTIEAGLLGLKNELLSQWSAPTSRGYAPVDVADFIGECLDRLTPNQQRRLLGVGVALPGIYDPNQELLLSSDILGWRNIRLKEQLEERLGVPTVVSSKVPAMAISEYLFGKPRAAGLLLLLRVSTGIGAALVLGGQVLAGHQGAAGEIGHTRVPHATHLCRCGRRGCLESLASIPAIQEAAFGRFGSLAWNALLRNFDNGESEVSELLIERIQYIRDVLETLVRLTAPSSVILTGPLIDKSKRAFHILSNGLSTATGARPHVSRSSFVGWESIAGIGAVCLQSWIYNPNAA